MNPRLRFAIIGCGIIATRHANEMKKHGKLVAVCDIVKEKADELAKKFSAKPYYDIDDLLQKEKKIDFIAICTPNGLHAEHSIKCLKAAHHVICEKPMALSLLDARFMVDAAEDYMKKLDIVMQNRFNPPVVFVKDLLDKNKLGKIFSFQLNCFWNRPPAYYKNSWHGTKKLDGGTLFTQFSHFIDLLYWFLGEVDSVNGIRQNFLHKNCIEFEDCGIANLQMKNGAIGTLQYTINATEKNMEGSLTLFGEKGTVKIGGQYLNVLEYFSVRGEKNPDLPKGNSSNDYGFYMGSMSNHGIWYETLLKNYNGASLPFMTNTESVKTVEIIEKIYKASPLLP